MKTCFPFEIKFRFTFFAALFFSFVNILFTQEKSASANEDVYFEIIGEVGAELRIFPNDAIHAEQKDQLFNGSITIQPEVIYEWNNGEDKFEFIPFARLDSHDHKRSHFDIRELNYLHIGDGWDVTVGFDKVFWGVIESRHLVDYINQTDGVESPDGEEKLGQAMINLGIQRDWGNLNLFYLPHFRERSFAGVEGRLRGGIVVDSDRAVYESSAEEFNQDFALRYSTYFGDWDLGLAHFHGTSREPRLVLGKNDHGDSVLVPHYDIIDRTSLDLQATKDAWLWKLEAIYESAENYDSFMAASVGVEYTFFGLIDNSGDIGLLAEYHRDNRNHLAPATLFDDDLFFGSRLTLNDDDDTSFLGGVIYDSTTKASLVTVEAETRVSDGWKLEVEANFYQRLSSEELLYSLRDDDHFLIRLTTYF